MPDASADRVGERLFVVAHGDDGAVLRLLDEDVVELISSFLVQMGLRFIKEQEVGSGDQDTCQQETLPLSAAQT